MSRDFHQDSTVSNKWIHITLLFSIPFVFFPPLCPTHTHTHTHSCENVRLFLEEWRVMYDLYLTLHLVQSGVRTAPLHHDLTLTHCSIRHTLAHTTHTCKRAFTCLSFQIFEQTHVYSSHRWMNKVPQAAVKSQDEAAAAGKGSENWRTVEGRGSSDNDMDGKIVFERQRETAESSWQQIPQTTVMSQQQTN